MVEKVPLTNRPEDMKNEPSSPVERGLRSEQPKTPTEQPASKQDEQPAPQPSAPLPLTQATVPGREHVKSETLERIEDIMEDDLDDVYAQLPPDVQKQFKERGEATAAELESMIYKVRLRSRKVFKLLFGWLKVIPGVNKYFLKQEAKLKADEILALKKELDQSRRNQL